MDGKGETYNVLVNGGSLAASGLNSPFERAFFGSQPDCLSIGTAVAAVKGPVITETDTSQCLKILRAAIKARRDELGMPAAPGRTEALDSALFDKGPVLEPIPNPTPRR